MIGIYKITSPTNKIYIGQSWNLEKRKYHYTLNHCKHQRKLYHSIRKHGWISHKFEIVECIDPLISTQKILNEKEKFWIKQYHRSQLLNLTEGGSNGKLSSETKNRISKKNKGFKHSEKTKRILSEKHTGKILSEETKKKISIAFKGKPLLESTKKKMSLSKLGKKKPNISKALTGRKLSPEHIKNLLISNKDNAKKKIIQLDLYGNEIKRWNSLTDASISLKINNGHISSVCKGKRKTAGGFKWSYSN